MAVIVQMRSVLIDDWVTLPAVGARCLPFSADASDLLTPG